MTNAPNLDDAHFKPVDPQSLVPDGQSTHTPRLLMIYGSLRERSYSRLSAEEGARIFERLGAEVKFYNLPVDVMEEMYRFTLLTRDIKDVLVDRYSERVESHAELSKRVNQSKRG